MLEALETQVFNWDSIIESPPEGGSDFVLLPPGYYPFTVTAFERGQHNGSAKLPSCPKAIVTLLIDTTTIKASFFLFGTTVGMITGFFTACGLRKHADALDLTLFPKSIGCSGYCKLIIREYTGRDGKQYKSNEVKTWLEPVEGKAKFEAQEKAGGIEPLTEQPPEIPAWKTNAPDDQIPF
jgi:hypothetical protein